MRNCIIFLLLLISIINLNAQDNTLTVSVSNQTPYIGERLIYQIQFTSQQDLSQAQIDLPAFIGFAQFPSPAYLSTQMINNVSYNVLQRDIHLYAHTTGNVTIEPTVILLPETPFQTALEQTSTSITLNVQSLPDNMPDTFNGAVGQFDMSTRLSQSTIQAGEPNTLEISIIGNGNFDQMVSPQHRLPESWQIFGNTRREVASNQTLQAKVFEYQFFPDQTGTLTIPAIIFTYFDPTIDTYRTITNQPLTFTVAGEFTSDNQIQIIDTLNNQLTLKSMTDEPSTVIPTPSFWLLWVITPLIAFVVFMGKHIKLSRSHRQSTYQQPQLKEIFRQLSMAQKQSPNTAHTTIENILLKYLSKRYNQQIQSIEQIHLITTDLPDSLQKSLSKALTQLREGQYAPVTEADTRRLTHRIYKIIQTIESV